MKADGQHREAFERSLRVATAPRYTAPGARQRAGAPFVAALRALQRTLDARGFLALAGMLPFLLWRVFDEERILTRDPPAYAEYRQRVRHRHVPRVW